MRETKADIEMKLKQVSKALEDEKSARHIAAAVLEAARSEALDIIEALDTESLKVMKTRTVDKIINHIGHRMKAIDGDRERIRGERDKAQEAVEKARSSAADMRSRAQEAEESFHRRQVANEELTERINEIEKATLEAVEIHRCTVTRPAAVMADLSKRLFFRTGEITMSRELEELRADRRETESAAIEAAGQHGAPQTCPADVIRALDKKIKDILYRHADQRERDAIAIEAARGAFLEILKLAGTSDNGEDLTTVELAEIFKSTTHELKTTIATLHTITKEAMEAASHNAEETGNQYRKAIKAKQERDEARAEAARYRDERDHGGRIIDALIRTVEKVMPETRPTWTVSDGNDIDTPPALRKKPATPDAADKDGVIRAYKEQQSRTTDMLNDYAAKIDAMNSHNLELGKKLAAAWIDIEEFGDAAARAILKHHGITFEMLAEWDYIGIETRARWEAGELDTDGERTASAPDWTQTRTEAEEGARRRRRKQRRR